MTTRAAQIEESEARGEVAALYEDLRAVFRSSFVPSVYRLLAVHAPYLPRAWHSLRPNLTTRYAERAADTIHRVAVTEIGRLPHGPRMPRAPADRDEIRAVLATFVSVNPKNLLVVTTLLQAWRGRAIAGRGADGDDDRGPIPLGVPAGMAPVPLLPQDAEDPRVRAIFAEALTVMARAAVPSIYRTLARWPDYLGAVWRPLADPARLAALQAGPVPALIAEATRLAHGFPFPFALDRATAGAALPAAALAAIESTLTTFQKGIAETMLQIARLVRDLDGDAGLRSRPFSVAG